MPDFSKVAKGGALRIPAATYNALMRIAERTSDPGLTGNATATAGYGQNVVRVKNTTGATVPRFGVLGIAGLELEPDGQTFPDVIVFSGETPTTVSHANRFLVTLEPIAADRVGLAAAAGVFPCKVNLTNTTHQFATVKNNDATQLASAACGVLQLLWIENAGATGADKWAVGIL